jgi:hypothetical protein
MGFLFVEDPIMSDHLRSRLIRLAHAKPELRPHLLPILGSRQKVAISQEQTLAIYPPEKAGTMAGAKQWIHRLEFVLTSTPANTPERAELIEEIKKTLWYAGFIYRANRGVSAFYKQQSKRFDDLVFMEVEAD